MTTDPQIIARHDAHGLSGLVVTFPDGVYQAGVPDRLVGLPTLDRTQAEKTAEAWVRILRRKQ